MAEKKTSFKKSFLIFLLVMTPPFWLLFTDEGSRVSDTALLWLLGEEEVKLDLGQLDADFNREEIQTVYPDLEWACNGQRSEFGDSLCAARIGTFNGFPARLLTFYFRSGRVAAMKLDYRENYHAQITGHLIGAFGQPGNVEAALAEGPDADSVLEWQLDGGTVLLKKDLTTNDQPALLWLARPPAG